MLFGIGIEEQGLAHPQTGERDYASTCGGGLVAGRPKEIFSADLVYPALIG